MALRTLVRRNNSGKLPVSIHNLIIPILLRKGRFFYAIVSLKQDKYHIYLAQLSLQSLEGVDRDVLILWNYSSIFAKNNVRFKFNGPKFCFQIMAETKKKSFWFRFLLKSSISKGFHWEISGNLYFSKITHDFVFLWNVLYMKHFRDWLCFSSNHYFTRT